MVELDCSPDDPVEIMVNDRVIAHGEVVVVSGNYGVRITKSPPATKIRRRTGRLGPVQPLAKAKVTKMFLTLLPYLTVIANLVLVLGILLGLNQRVRQLRARAGQQEKTLETETARLSAEIVELKGQIQELEQTGNSLGSGTAARARPLQRDSSVNNTLRSKVLKMHRLGQSPDRIAGALRVPKGEVDLLVKVHKIVMRPYEEVVLAPLGRGCQKNLK